MGIVNCIGSYLIGGTFEMLIEGIIVGAAMGKIHFEDDDNHSVVGN